MAKVGKPPLIITDEMIKKAESLAANGLTIQEICDCLDMGVSTLYDKCKEYPQFGEAIKRGKSKGIGMMANNLVKLAKGGNAAANIFWLKSRAKWKEGDEDNNEAITKINQTLEQTKELIIKCFPNLSQK